MSEEELYQKGDIIGGKYEIRGTLGKGGFGIVYLAYDLELHDLVAIKTFRDELLANSKARNAFKQESLLWANLEEHPHILAARWVSEASGRLFVSMDYIAPDAKGRVSLHDHLATANGPLETNQVLGWAIQFCLGMEHAQARGLECHRDIKPGNILIAQDWTLKIADFGLAAAATIAWSESSGNCDSLLTGTGEAGVGFSVIRTESGMRCGTPGYMAPEVYRFEGANIRSDIYGFGVVLWQMAAGSRIPPWAVLWRGEMESYEREIYEQQMARCLMPVEGLLGPVIARCLQPKPSERYGNFQGLRKTFEAIWTQRTGTIFLAPLVAEKTATFWHNKGGALDVLGQHDQAIGCYNKALKTDPENASTWANKGVALDNLAQHKEAVECYDKALAIDPRHALAWNNKGIALDELGHHEEALNCYDKAMAIEVDVHDASGWTNRGNTLNALGRYEEAIHCLDKALAIDPRQIYAWNNKAMALKAVGQHEQAIECYSKALMIDPQYVVAWRNKGKALQSLGRHEKAVLCFDEALKIDARDTNALFNKGYSYANSNKHEEALGCYEKLLALDAQHAGAWLCKASSEEALGRVRDAVRSLRRFAESIPVEDATRIDAIRHLLRKLESKAV